MSTISPKFDQRTSYANNRVGITSQPAGGRTVSTGPVRRSSVSRPAFERDEDDPVERTGDRYDRRPKNHADFLVCNYEGGKQVMNKVETARYIEFYDKIYNEGMWFRVKRYDTDAGWGFSIEWFGRDIRLPR